MRKDKQGFSLPMMLMILTAVLLSTLFIVNLVMNELKISLASSNSIIAFHAAESGVEQALWHIKYGKEMSDFSSFDALSSQGGIDLGDANYSISSVSLAARFYTVYDISPSNPAHVDIIDPTGNMDNQIWDGSVDNFSYDWSIDDCYPEHAADRLQTSIYYFTGNLPSEPEYNSDVESSVAVCNCEFGSNRCTGRYVTDLQEDRAYRIIFRPLDDDVASLELVTGNTPLFSQAVIISEGSSGQSNYRIRAQTPILSSVSDIFTYIIFSEEELTK